MGREGLEKRREEKRERERERETAGREEIVGCGGRRLALAVAQEGRTD